MSWYVQPVAVHHDTAEADLENLEIIGQSGASVDEAVAASRKAAIGLIRSGALGWGVYRVSLNGHANPDHIPVAGTANDVITITVTQI